MTIKSRVALALLCGSPLMANAVGLGDIRLSSALNQPFVADIDLLSVPPDELKQLHASLSSPETFASHGVDRPSFLSSMTFKVTTDRSGHAVLQVRTPEVVTEPFVTLLIEVSWPQGRLVREYTVLLDPPVFADHATTAPRLQAPVMAPIPDASNPAPVPVTESKAGVAHAAAASVKTTQTLQPKASRPTDHPVTARKAPPVTPEPAAPMEAMTASGQVYEVTRGDSLSGIGRRVAGVSRSQMNRWMVATFRSNPTAFDGNINRLRKNMSLTLPTETEWRSIDASVAARQVHQQVTDWASGVTHTVPSASAASKNLDATRLRLVPSKETAATDPHAVTPQATLPSGPMPGASTATPKSTDPSVDPTVASNEVSRLAALQQEVIDAKRQLELKTTELAEMQRGTATEAAPSAVTPAVAVAPVMATPAVQAGPVDWLRDHALALISALLALGVALWGYTLWRRKRADARFHEAIASPTLAAWGTAEPTGFGSIRADHDARKDLNEGGAARHRAAATGVSVTAADPLAEADFHIAYGLYGQAADLLNQALVREPQQRSFKLKLLEVYYVAGNADEFLSLAQALRDSAADAAPGEWQNILLMGAKLLPEHPLFASGVVAQRDTSLDFDLGAGEATRVDVNTALRPSQARAALRLVEDSKLEDTQPRLPKLKEGSIPPSMVELGLDLDKLLADSSASADATMQIKIDDDARFKVRDLVDQAAERGAQDAAGRNPASIDRSQSPETALGSDRTMAVETLNLDDLGLESPMPEALSAMATQLELARAYLAMGDAAGARGLALEVAKGGSADEVAAAQQFLNSLS